MAKFKAKIAFSYENEMFYPHEIIPYELPDEIAKELAAVGYAEIIEEKPKRGKKDAVKN